MGVDEVLIRVAAALIAGGAIGLERERTGHAAGLRTTMLVCLAACLAMLISESFFTDRVFEGLATRPDPARLAAGVLTGMGFIGAGAVFRTGNRVQGLTTAATLWIVSILGLAFGSGQLLIGGVGFVLAIVTLALLPSLENRVSSDQSAKLSIEAGMDGASNDELRACIVSCGMRIGRFEIEYDSLNRRKVLRFDVKFKKHTGDHPAEAVLSSLASQKDVTRLTWS